MGHSRKRLERWFWTLLLLSPFIALVIYFIAFALVVLYFNGFGESQKMLGG